MQPLRPKVCSDPPGFRFFSIIQTLLPSLLRTCPHSNPPSPPPIIITSNFPMADKDESMFGVTCMIVYQYFFNFPFFRGDEFCDFWNCLCFQNSRCKP